MKETLDWLASEIVKMQQDHMIFRAMDDLTCFSVQDLVRTTGFTIDKVSPVLQDAIFSKIVIPREDGDDAYLMSLEGRRILTERLNAMEAFAVALTQTLLDAAIEPLPEPPPGWPELETSDSGE